MSALKVHITPAGIAAIVNAQNTGTSQVLIAQIGITDQVFSAEGAAALPGEIKRLVTFGGAAVAADTIHLTIRDDSADAYTLRGFGLYLGDGTLFAVYSHAGETPDYIMQKASAALLMLQADIRFTQLNATAITFGNADWLNPPATTTVQGVVELADNAEAIAGTDGTRAITPAADKAALDARLGANAPSAFFKPLLALGTALAIRTALELKGAALKDEGANNGLDADKLDGQHGAYYLDWSNLSNKPAAYPPTGHGHAWGDLSNVPATAIRWPSFAEVTDKPATYPPSGHIHAAADVHSGVFDVARIPDIGVGKVTNLQTLLDAKAPIANPTFTGTATAGGVVSSGGNLTAQATAGQNAHVWLRDEAGGNQGLLFWDRGGGDVIRLRRYNAAGTGAEGELCIYATTITYNGYGLWHAGNFDPNSKANLSGASFTGNVTALNLIAGGGGNGAFVQVGDDVKLIDIGVANAIGVQGMQTPSVGYFYFGTSNTRFGWDGGNLVWGGGRVWHEGIFNPDSKATNGANVYFADITASRGNGTGVIFLGGGSRYLYWDGGSYQMPGGQLVVEGGFQKGSSRELKIIDGPLPYGLEELMRIETAIGRYKPEFIDEGERRRLFVIAEQLAEVVPEPVFGEAIEWEDRRVAAVDDGQLVPLLIKSVQQLAERVFALEGKA